MPRTVATSVHVHDHVNVQELCPRLTLDVDVVVDVHVDVVVDVHVDVVVDVHVDVIGFFISLRLRRPQVNPCPIAGCMSTNFVPLITK